MNRSDPQPLSMQFTEQPRRLRVQVAGEGTLDNTIAYWREIVARLQAISSRSARVDGLMLIDETQGEPLTAAQWQALVAAMAGQGLDDIRIAHVKPRGLQKIEHCEIFAREAGLDARVFDDETTADLWLRYGER